VEFVYKKLLRLLDGLPVARGPRCVFATEGMAGDVAKEQEEQTAEGRPWWDLRRAPRSISDWLAITVIGGIAVGVILAMVFLAF
jgi:hypothetical protein